MEKVTRSEFAEENWVKKGIAELNSIIESVTLERKAKAKDDGDMDLIILDWMIRRAKDWSGVVWWNVFIKRFKSPDYDYTEPRNEINGLRVYYFLWDGPIRPVITVRFGEDGKVYYDNGMDDLDNDIDLPVEFPKGHDIPLKFFEVGNYLTDYKFKNEETFIFEALWRLKGLFKDISEALEYDVRRTELFDQTFDLINKVLHIKAYPKIEWKKGIRLLSWDGRQINLKLYPNHNAPEKRKAMEMVFVNSDMYDTDGEFLIPEVVTMYGENQNG